VHGGADLLAPACVTPALLAKLQGLIRFDPLHMPHNIAPIEAMAAARPSVPQVACFDTAFHSTLPPVARRTGLPLALEAEGIRRYGFHGLSYEYIAGRLAEEAPELARGRTVVAHLGSGASLCALQAGRSIATTMGFSSLDGLLMATRCGSLDPGIILHLGRAGRSFADIEDMLYRCSGLLGVSAISGDIRELLATDDPHAAEAIELFTYRIAAETAAMACALGGLDGLVFTAGIGEHAPSVRAEICARLAWLGVSIDLAANASGVARISTAGSPVEVRVMPTDEEAMIARHTKAALERAVTG
jgi:acetate kinase